MSKSVKEKKVIRKKKNFGIILEYTPVSRNIFADEEVLKQINGEFKRAKGITPQYLADRYSICVSTAKKLLKEAEEQKIITLVAKNNRTSVYSSV